MKISLLALVLCLAAGVPAHAADGISPAQSTVAGEALDTSGPMTHEKFARYIKIFNSADLRFVEFYSPDIVFDKGPVEGKLIGREAIRKWYADIWRDIKETIIPLSTAIDSGGKVMLVELRTQLMATRDNVVRPRLILNKGDQYSVDGTIVYTIENGLITSIRGGSDEITVTRADGTQEKP